MPQLIYLHVNHVCHKYQKTTIDSFRPLSWGHLLRKLMIYHMSRFFLTKIWISLNQTKQYRTPVQRITCLNLALKDENIWFIIIRRYN